METIGIRADVPWIHNTTENELSTNASHNE